ncbi:Hypothetical protein NTJ_14525 [Nesidiocoris tenuis]|uniref:Uncharacterized protein n=1 Tax=Nesidiocoris tenuis TaxID=355587 RepID=A0ABN7BBI8_9HEMI|nr:Hypothetical protein NTJ_14525 [Nesidiocoris tenuis]
MTRWHLIRKTNVTAREGPRAYEPMSLPESILVCPSWIQIYHDAAAVPRGSRLFWQEITSLKEDKLLPMSLAILSN